MKCRAQVCSTYKMFDLRPYQITAKEAVLNEWRKGNRKTLLVLPTGSGKTIIFSSIVEEQVREGKRVLILAHRDVLIEQAAEKLKMTSNLKCVFEKGKSHYCGSDVPVTISSIQTMSKEERLEQFPKKYFHTIIIDEAHHSVAKCYKRILDHFESANILGVTATPDRGDLENLGAIFESVAYEYSIEEAVAQGYLCKIKAQMIPVEIDLNHVSSSNNDFDKNEVDTELDSCLEQIAFHMKFFCQKRKTVVFLPLIKTAQKFVKILENHDIKAIELNGKTPERERILKEFENGKYDVLCNAVLLTEGWDCPKVDCIIVLRPTRRRSFYQQMVGRGMRIAEGKDHLLLLDFLWLSKRHALCKPSSLVAADKETSAKIDEYVLDSMQPVDLLQAVSQAKEDMVKIRENSLARKLDKMSTRKSELIDPLEYARSIGSNVLDQYAEKKIWELDRATKEQLDFLLNKGINTRKIRSRGRAAQIINLIGQRQSLKMSSPKQIRCLEDMGFKQVGKWTCAQASRMISIIAANNWVVPNDINPAEYVPEKGG